jgi:hypothetical protein
MIHGRNLLIGDGGFGLRLEGFSRPEASTTSVDRNLVMVLQCWFGGI